ncbi:MAG: FAD-dependent oxidoreductase [Nitrososphaerota archaeon]|nr:FAD-dependent oxidoreductase [Nitrososphaerota archaeon]
MPDHVDYLIVGGGVAGGHAAYAIRKQDRTGRIVVVSDEMQFPYDRVPLSKEFLAGKRKRRELFFKGDAYYPRNKVEVIRERRTEALDISSKTVRLDDGQAFSYRRLLLATGGRPRKLELPGSDLAGIYYLRTLEDCDAIRKASSDASRAVIVGGGFIGCEVAATLRGRGLKVTLVELGDHLLGAAIDEKTAGWIQGYHIKQGVKVLTKTTVDEFVGKDGRVTGVKLGGGLVVPADFVVVGVGIIPNIAIAEKAGLKVDRGIIVDRRLRTSAADVYAAGDVARFYSPILKRVMRVEHYDVAERQGAVAGSNMAGRSASFDELPYFFSNQYDLEINAYGDLSSRTSTILRGDLDSKVGFLRFYFNGTVLDGVLSVNREWDEIEKAKALVERRRPIADPSAVGDESRALS